MGFMFPANGNLGRFGNSAAWWLGIQPYELFFYVFLPPLLLDAAVRIDFFLFKKVRLYPYLAGQQAKLDELAAVELSLHCRCHRRRWAQTCTPKLLLQSVGQ